MTVRATPTFGEAGYYTVSITVPGEQTVDVTMFREAPTQIQSFSFTDPFGPAVATVAFPQVTALEECGQGDLWWMVPNADVDIVWRDDKGNATDWRWEGYLASEEIGPTTRTWQCKGALQQVDNFLAKPQIQIRPVPLEHVIRDAFDPARSPSLRTKPLYIDWPDEWPTVLQPSDVNKAYEQTSKDGTIVESPLVPEGVVVGERWSGYATRDTGAWANKLSLIQDKLKNMVAPDGSSWTVSCATGRQPVLHVRQQKFRPDEKTWHVTYGAPGVECQVARDWSQAENVIYGTGKGLDGQQFSNMFIHADGKTVDYQPFAALPSVYPAMDTSTGIAAGRMRREVLTSFDEGLDFPAAKRVTEAQLRKMAEPGLVGSIALTSDPRRDGIAIHRALIRAGDTIAVHGLLGRTVLFHITESTFDTNSAQVSLSVDSKYRDAVTVEEVQNRTRDALAPINSLKLGRFNPAITDLILPWSYMEGAGCIPQQGINLLKQVGGDPFPWTSWTTKYPPKDRPEWYVKIPKASEKVLRGEVPLLAETRWTSTGIPIYVGQFGSIGLTQLAIYDENGNVLPVSFHFSVYQTYITDPSFMPQIPDEGFDSTVYRYQVTEPYPFFRNAFEKIDISGQEFSSDVQNVTDASGGSRIAGWGNGVVRAGYSPGTPTGLGANKTGKLHDEEAWKYDTTRYKDWAAYSAQETRDNAVPGEGDTPGFIYGMLFCDDVIDQDIYILGRLFRQPDGTSGA